MAFHQLLFYLLVFLLPIQLGKHFWPEWSFVFGLPVDYLSPTLYLTDFLIFGILISWGIEKLKVKSAKLKVISVKQSMLPIILLGIWLVGSFLTAANRGVFFYKFIKLFEFSLLGLYIAKNHYSFVIRNSLPFAMIYSSLIAIGQFIKQASLNGIFWWLGERTFTVSTPGIAKTELFNRPILRSYSLFPHPNVLAGFLLISLVLVVFGFKKRKGFVFWLSSVLSVVAIFLSFSKVVWLAGIMIVSFFLFKKYWKKKKIVFLISSLVFLLGLILVRFALDPLSISRRLDLARASFLMIKRYPLFGVGLGNFSVRLPYFYWSKESIRFFQPVHNIFLFVAVETGLIGLLIFVWFLFKTYKHRRGEEKILALSTILFTGFFDHYWLTLQQGQLLFAVVLGLIWQVKEGPISLKD